MKRRTMLSAGAAFGLAPFAAAAAPALDLSKPVDMFNAYARMRGRGAAGPGLWWYEGTAFGQRAGEPQEALLGIEGFSFNRLIVNADGTLSQHMAETGYFKDLKTGAIVDSWVNPYTGQSVKPAHYHTRQNVVATVDSLKSEESGRARGETKGRIGPAISGVDTTWITENFSTKIALPPREGETAGAVMIASSMAVFAALTKDLADAKRDFVPATLTFQSVGDRFLPWMGMGAAPGLSVWQLMGRKVRTSAECPPILRARIDKDFPGWLADPGV
jgi:hypothetical protein